jgi:hypothetical protein
MSKSIDLDKLRTINQATGGNVRVRKLVDATGRRAGFQIDHADGRMEGIVRPERVSTKVSVSTGEAVTDG